MTTAVDPVFAEAREARRLSGFSGASVALMTRDGEHWFVRKAARDRDGNARLRGQLAKQQEFIAIQGAAVRAPAVLGDGELDGRFYFDMSFVRGTDGVSYLRRASYSQVTAAADQLCAYVRDIATRPVARLDQPSLFDALYARMCDVHRRTNAIAGDTLARLFLALERLQIAGATLAPTMCHGDLTLENVVIDPDGVFWLVDFLDSPFDHWWQDIVKLHQDLDGGWYQVSSAPIARCVLDYLSRRLLQQASDLDAAYPSVHAVLLACTFARILPYTRTADERRFVLHRVEHFVHQSFEHSSNLTGSS